MRGERWCARWNIFAKSRKSKRLYYPNRKNESTFTVLWMNQPQRPARWWVDRFLCQNRMTTCLTNKNIFAFSFNLFAFFFFVYMRMATSCAAANSQTNSDIRLNVCTYLQYKLFGSVPNLEARLLACSIRGFGDSTFAIRRFEIALSRTGPSQIDTRNFNLLSFLSAIENSSIATGRINLVVPN